MGTPEQYFEDLHKDYINQMTEKLKKINEANSQKNQWYHDICVSFEFLKKYHIKICDDTYSVVILPHETMSHEFYAMFCWSRNEHSMDLSGLHGCDELYEVLSNKIGLYYRNDTKYNYYIKPNKFKVTNDINEVIKHIFDTLYKPVLKYWALIDNEIVG